MNVKTRDMKLHHHSAVLSSEHDADTSGHHQRNIVGNLRPAWPNSLSPSWAAPKARVFRLRPSTESVIVRSLIFLPVDLCATGKGGTMRHLFAGNVRKGRPLVSGAVS
jgi:hypothetical protein